MTGPIGLPPAAGPQLPGASAATPPNETARDFEAVFLGQMLQLMLESVETGEFGGGSAEGIYRGMLAEKLGREVASRGGIGLAPAVMDQILKLQQAGSE
ncbi:MULTISPECIES: rod-binding protein [unclassified Sphingosinithalassobacter]|uniref:rod-binding protein n=1 Tax=unclassified Sphingosinithalassobacter TaxID=2676235 RepID=UPI00165DAF44|nr:rod-binding protein [Sphingosinithalassobacter sp. CS137]